MRIEIGKERLCLVMAREGRFDSHTDDHLADGDRSSLKNIQLTSLGIELDEVHEPQLLIANDRIKCCCSNAKLLCG